MQIELTHPVPVFRIFSVEKAKEFYIDYLGLTIDWEHRFEDGMPLYMQVSRGSFVLHLSEHHGDATPGSAAFVVVKGLHNFHKELASKNYLASRPGINKVDWGSEMVITDPFGNKIRFSEKI